MLKEEIISEVETVRGEVSKLKRVINSEHPQSGMVYSIQEAQDMISRIERSVDLLISKAEEL